ncbi:MAG: hypothetical protein RLZZ342_466 [Candidatus Parcubacteria bacterium]
MRSLILSNGELCVALDEVGRVRDIYYPHVGQEDHVRGHYMHRVGVWADGTLSWLGEDSRWEIQIGCEENALASSIVARHKQLRVELHFTDVVYNERPLFVRRVQVKNTTDSSRDIKLYFAHQFEIYKSHGGDTAYYDPLTRSLIHYKGRRVFLIGAEVDREPFQDYATGRTGFNGQEGTHRDADDGMLSKNPVEHGPVDSVLGLYAHYEPGQERMIDYWIAAAETIERAHELTAYVREKTAAHLVRTTSDFWKAWVSAYDWHLQGLSREEHMLFNQSRMCVRAHVDRGGGILASLDSDMLQYGIDTYSYVWPRDAAYIALALDAAGDSSVAKRFFQFAAATISKEGYMCHKYLPDRSLGSSWHSWVRDGHPALPIQEDETALTVIALNNHFSHSRDVEFLESMYNPLVKKAAEFMLEHRDPIARLPLPSYDLWEEKWGTHTYTAASVYAALAAAADMAQILGKRDDEERYRAASAEVQKGIMEYLWDQERGVFIKHIDKKDTLLRDTTIDASSVYGVFLFGVLPLNDPRLSRAWENTVRSLSYGITIGGLARYERDNYYRQDEQSAGNPWVITTLWYAEYLIARAKKEHDLDQVKAMFAWVVKRALPSGALAEQFHPTTGAPLSATPLAWSHSGYVHAVIKYLDKLEELGLCKECNPAP